MGCGTTKRKILENNFAISTLLITTSFEQYEMLPFGKISTHFLFVIFFKTLINADATLIALISFFK